MSRRLRHGFARRGYKNPEYQAWVDMHQRCYNPKCAGFKNYGARGILVCDRWEDFGNFIHDMGRRPTGLSLERVDNSKGYSPDNCKWATKFEQCNNTRRNVRIGNRTIAQVSRDEGISWCTLRYRRQQGLPFNAGLYKSNSGEHHHLTVLTADATAKIRRRYATNSARGQMTRLARQFGVSVSTISNVIHFKTHGG